MKQRTISILVLLSSCFGVPALALSPVDRPLQLEPIDRESLCVTNGTVVSLPNGRLAIDSASSRAVARKLTSANRGDSLPLSRPDGNLEAAGIWRTTSSDRNQATRPGQLQPAVRDVAYRA